ncbi:MAG TPA: hypothetical protein VD994_14290, partial [Prosthecobacter sp.]|nr:hypothetical protein [Prosthecobacter sp.]
GANAAGAGGSELPNILNGTASDANSGTVLGIAVTGISSGNGTWEYSVDGGANWIPVGMRAQYDVVEDDDGNVTVVPSFTSAGSPSDSNALLLRAEDKIRFVPDEKNATAATLTFRAWDESSGYAGDYVDASTTGGTTAFSTDSDTADITVTDLNDAPTVSGGPVTLTGIKDYQTSTAVTVASILGDAGLAYADVDTAYVEGVAATATSGAGNWQYSSDGTNWNNFDTVAENSALLLLPSYSVRYVPAVSGPAGGETAQLTLRGWDQTGATGGGEGTKMDASVRGGTTAYSTNTFLTQITVTEDTQALAVTTVGVNEASPYAVFTVSGDPGQRARFSITNTTTTGLTEIEYYDDTAWVAYTGGTYVSLPAGGSVLVRVALAPEQDTAVDGGETFKLVATTTGGTASTGGTATIYDDGTGAVYKYADASTSTPLPSNDPDYPALDDDRPPVVTGTTVNEASPYAVFTVAGVEGQLLELTLGDTGSDPGDATLGTDTGVQADLEYFNGTSWVSYTAGSFIAIPQVGGALNGEAANLLVRVAVHQDTAHEGPETFTLNASTTSGTSHTGTTTISDEGTGAIFKYADANTSTPLPSNDPDYPALDDDRPLAVAGTTVNEASPYAVFTVTTVEGQSVKLTLGDTGTDPGDATLGTDTGVQANLEYYNGTAWVSYTAGSYVVAPQVGGSLNGEVSVLLVRVAIYQDAGYEGPETFTLTAETPSAISSTGTMTIADDGTGVIYKYPNTNTSTPLPSNDPDYPALDDDRPLVVTGTTVNEASPYATFTVAGIEGQLVKLTIGSTGAGSGHAILGTDTGVQADLEYYDGSSWVAYTAGSFITIPQLGGALNGEAADLLVRVPVYQDTNNEGAETFALTAATTSDTNGTGSMTITDDGTGVIFKYPDVNTPTPLPSTDPDYPMVDDDRPLAVTGATVNEASPYATFTV